MVTSRTCGDAGAAGQERPYGLAGPAVRLLREVADGGGGRGQAQVALLGGDESGEHPEQGGLARAVGADDRHQLAGRP